MSIDLNDLESELSKSRRKVADWAIARTQAASARKDQHAAFLSDQTDKLSNLKGLQAQLQVTAELTSKRLQNEAEEVKCTEERLVGTNAEVSTSERQLELSQAQLQKRQVDYMRKAEGIERDKRKRQAELDALRKEVDLFGERFGLRFGIGQGYLELVMTHIDARDCDKEFHLAVAVQDGDMAYTVTKCEPPIPDLDELTAKVNETNNFGAFVKAVRSRFVAIAREEATA
ncbi:hypothetical protein PLESTM_001741800 [Pleodorina starrii]|nr:hypothetical protein PLESTM_001741800 [Pleodorina starrii]